MNGIQSRLEKRVSDKAKRPEKVRAAIAETLQTLESVDVIAALKLRFNVTAILRREAISRGLGPDGKYIGYNAAADYWFNVEKAEKAVADAAAAPKPAPAAPSLEDQIQHAAGALAHHGLGDHITRVGIAGIVLRDARNFAAGGR